MSVFSRVVSRYKGGRGAALWRIVFCTGGFIVGLLIALDGFGLVMAGEAAPQGASPWGLVAFGGLIIIFTAWIVLFTWIVSFNQAQAESSDKGGGA